MSGAVEEELDRLGLVEEYLSVLTDVISLKRKLKIAKKHQKKLEESFPQLSHIAGNSAAIYNRRVFACSDGSLVRRVVAKDEDDARRKLAKLTEEEAEKEEKGPPSKKAKKGD
jgi:hypothetical protein